MIENFALKSHIHFNMGSMEVLEQITGSKAFIVSDPIMEELGYVQETIDYLDKSGISALVFTGVSPDPDISVVATGMRAYEESKADIIIAIGGGSAIDTAKGIIYFSWHNKNTGNQAIEKPQFIAIPSTSGTGSEVTNFTVITSGDEKVCIVDDIMAPDIAILDSTCIQNLPYQIMVNTGIDALVHSIEAYVSTKANDFTDALAEKSIKLIFENLEKVCKNSKDHDARDRVHNASCMAGIAFTNTSLGINHSLAHALGGNFKIPHGQANALLLTKVIKYNADIKGSADGYAAKKYSQLATILELPARTYREGVISLVEAIDRMYKNLEVKVNIRDLQIEKDTYESRISSMAEVALNDRCTPTNPRKPSKEDLISIYQECY